ncbi:MAG: N-methyl-D-aspartate receptor subunit [Parcubacteria group bacterium]|nr:N-methyl-D-aspartate receptor subunit [Parcubacteria group bacterium]
MRMNLEERWSQLWKELKGRGDGKALYAMLVHCYGERGREYHNLSHLEHCFEELDEVRSLALNPSMLEFKLWLHDVFYTIGPKIPGLEGDEEASAEAAYNILIDGGMGYHAASDAYTGILCTLHNEEHSPSTTDDRLLVDIDLAILGQRQERFDEYERQIRQEYDWVPEGIFQKRRAEILTGMYQRPHLYYTEHFQKKYEDQTRKNLARSIKRLQSS